MRARSRGAANPVVAIMVATSLEGEITSYVLALPPRNFATSSSLDPIYAADTLHWHCCSKPCTKVGSAYPSHTSRFSVGCFLPQETKSSAAAKNTAIRKHRFIDSLMRLTCRTIPEMYKLLYRLLL